MGLQSGRNGCLARKKNTLGSQWQKWVLGEEEEHIRLAYEIGIQTFDTANVYSNGLSEVILGKAIKELNLPRDEVVVMTKVYFNVGHRVDDIMLRGGRYPNEHGLSRKPKTMQALHDVVKASYTWLIRGYGKANEGNNKIVRRVEILAKKKDLTMAQVALAWIISKDQVSAPVVGTTNLNNLEELVTAVNIKLDEEEIK
ncbi:unnamed protein product [Rhizoctonia solani]|uniref:NADP-dependent oxidoreductase domain-containing protein n=1 Tax=Rhizoctonia solani TaxID=456999 RepID=A0A8H3HSP2_9AGAM|nr:unnamed protein product [Rhizoctonia solani]